MCILLFSVWRSLWRESGWFSIEKNSLLQLPFSNRVFELNSENAAFILAAIFAVHPACCEIATYIIATSSLQAAVFYLLAFYIYLENRKSPGLKSLGISVFFFFCSVASKEEGITFPAIVFLSEFYLTYIAEAGGEGPKKLRPIFIRSMKVSGPYWLAALALGGWLFALHPEEGNLSRGDMDWKVYFMTQWKAYLWYMRLWFWPWDLNLDYVVFPFSWTIQDGPAQQALIGNILLLILGFTLRKKYPAFFFGLLWFYITISPASSVVVLGEPVNEHRMYLAYVGFVGGSFVLFLKLFEGTFGVLAMQRYLLTVLSVAFAGLFVGTQLRNQVWLTEKALWTDTVEKNPMSGRAHNNLALVLAGEGQIERAIKLLEDCDRLWAKYMFCAVNRGWAYTVLLEKSRTTQGSKDYEILKAQAKSSFDKAIEYNSNSVYANYQMGRFYKDYMNDCKTALIFYEKAIALNGNRYPSAQAGLAICYVKLGKLTEAEDLVRRSYSVEPNNELVLAAKGDVERAKGNLESARETYRQIMERYPGLEIGYQRAAYLEIARKSYAEAAAYLLKWVAIAPGSNDALLNLAIAAKKTGEAQALDPLIQKYIAANSEHSKESFQQDLAKKEKELW